MTRTPVRILCVDDHAFLVEGLKARFDLETDLECVGRLGTADNLVGEVEKLHPDIVLLDIDMPGADPFEALNDLARAHPGVKTVILSAHVRDHYIDSAVKSGAWGYLSKSDHPDTIIGAVRKVVDGEFAFSPEALERCQNVGRGRRASGDDSPRSKLESLTPRETQILRLIGKGMSRADIAQAIFRSPKTVDAHRMAIMEKLDIHDRVDLARFAIREGLVEP